MKAPCPIIEAARVTIGNQATTAADGMNGAFVFMHRGSKLICIACDGSGYKPKNIEVQPYQLVIVARHDRLPDDEDLKFIHGMFWDPGHRVETVIPPPEKYSKNHCVYMHRMSRIQTQVWNEIIV